MLRKWREKRNLARLVKPANDKNLDSIGYMVGMQRKPPRKIFFGLITIRESDKKFRARIKKMMQKPPTFRGY